MVKFYPGDRVQMTDETRKVNAGARSFVGTVIYNSRIPGVIAVRRDGQKTVMLWHENAWEPLKEKKDG